MANSPILQFRYVSDIFGNNSITQMIILRDDNPAESKWEPKQAFFSDRRRRILPSGVWGRSPQRPGGVWGAGAWSPPSLNSVGGLGGPEPLQQE